MMSYGDAAMAEITRRRERAKRLLARLTLPEGLDWREFLAHPDVEDLDLDFVTASQMFQAYRGEELKEVRDGG